MRGSSLEHQSLAQPSLRVAEGLERWYHQPPSHIRSYEWAPLAAAVIATIVVVYRQSLASRWRELWLPILAYYDYLVANLLIIKPGRTAKWLRNSMPLWLILGWHVLLTRSIEVPQGDWNSILVTAVLAGVFPFFWEDYYTLQKFVRGWWLRTTCRSHCCFWPSHLGRWWLFSCLLQHSVRERIVAYKAVSMAMVVAMTAAIWLSARLIEASSILRSWTADSGVCRNIHDGCLRHPKAGQVAGPCKIIEAASKGSNLSG